MNIRTKIIFVFSLGFIVLIASAFGQSTKSKPATSKEIQPTTAAGIQLKKEIDALGVKVTTIQSRAKPLDEEIKNLNKLIRAKQEAKQPTSVEVSRRKQLSDQVNPLHAEESKLVAQINVKKAQLELTESRK